MSTVCWYNFETVLLTLVQIQECIHDQKRNARNRSVQHLIDMNKISLNSRSTSATTSTRKGAYHMLLFFTFWLFDIWELVWLLQMILMRTIHTETQSLCLLCFGILAIGKDEFSTRNHCHQTWRSSDHTFVQT